MEKQKKTLVIGVIGVFYYFSGKWKTRKLLV